MGRRHMELEQTGYFERGTLRNMLQYYCRIYSPGCIIYNLICFRNSYIRSNEILALHEKTYIQLIITVYVLLILCQNVIVEIEVKNIKMTIEIRV